MPYFHCKKCHHEFESIDNRVCDWCGGESYILELETPLEKFVKKLLENIEEIDPKIAKVVDENFWDLI